MFEGGSAGEEGVGDGVWVGLGVVFDVRGELRGLGAEGLGVAGGEDDRCDARLYRRTRVLRNRFAFRGLLQDDVGVGAADAERGDRGPAWPARLGPLLRLGEEAYGAGIPVDVGRGLIHVQRVGQYAVAHGLHHLDDAGDAGGGLGVADVGFERAQPQRPVGRPVLAVSGEQGLGLDRVTEGGTRTVRLHRVDLVCGQSRIGQRSPNDPLLGWAVGRGEAVGGAVLVGGRAAQYGEYRVVVAARLGEAFQYQEADALAPSGAVGRGGECLAAAVGGEAALSAELDEHAGCGHDGGSAGQGHGGLAATQRLGGQVQGDQ